MMAVISPIPGIQAAAVGVGLVAVEEGELPAADGFLERMAGPLEERVVDHQRRAHERGQGVVMVAENPGGPEGVETVQEEPGVP